MTQLGQTQQWTVVPDFDRITAAYLKNKNKPQRYPISEKRCGRFYATKITTSVLADIGLSTKLSSSPDLRLKSIMSQSSQLAPMTGFRPDNCLHAYSGGTVRELHTIIYSPAGLLPLPQALNSVILTYIRVYH